MEKPKSRGGRPKGSKDRQPRKRRAPTVKRAIVAIDREAPVMTGEQARATMATYVELGLGWDKRNALRGLQAQVVHEISISLSDYDKAYHRASLCQTLEVLHRLELEDLTNAPAGAVDITPPSKMNGSGHDAPRNPIQFAPFLKKV